MKDIKNVTNGFLTMFCLIDDSITVALSVCNLHRPKGLCQHISVVAG